jgi:hypothetical protein
MHNWPTHRDLTKRARFHIAVRFHSDLRRHAARVGGAFSQGALVKDGAPGWPLDDPVARSAASPPHDHPITTRSPPITPSLLIAPK